MQDQITKLTENVEPNQLVFLKIKAAPKIIQKFTAYKNRWCLPSFAEYPKLFPSPQHMWEHNIGQFGAPVIIETLPPDGDYLCCKMNMQLALTLIVAIRMYRDMYSDTVGLNHSIVHILERQDSAVIVPEPIMDIRF